MSIYQIAAFESKTMGPITVHRGWDEATREQVHRHAFDPGIVASLGEKDQNRFAPGSSIGDRTAYTAWQAGNLAGLFWVGPKSFPSDHFPESPSQPPYTVAWRTAYQTPEGATYEGQGIGRALGRIGLANFAELTKDGGPDNLPPLAEAGAWLDTGVTNTAGQGLYHHLANTERGQVPLGFVDAGVYTPPIEPGKSPEEPRVGMVIEPATLDEVIRLGNTMITHHHAA